MLENFFLDKIKDIIDKAESSLKLYDIVTKTHLDKFDLLSDDDNIKLFQQNFIVMNALFQLEPMYYLENKTLHISPLSISLSDIKKKTNKPLKIANNDDNLASYYLDWTNFSTTTAEDVKQLLNQFWQTFISKEEWLEALIVLQLPADASQGQIVKQYRKLANQYHPDKGGNQQQFISLKKAYETLKANFDN